MRKLLLSAVLALGFNAAAQEAYVSGLIDLRNAVVGSDPTQNKPAFDGLFKVTMIGGSGFKMDVQYETFKKIGFVKQAVGIGWDFEVNEKINISPSIEPTMIHRDWKGEHGYNKTHHLGAGGSLSVRYRLTDRFGLEGHFNTLFRGDLDWRYGSGAEPWVTSFYGGLTYRID